MENNQTKSFGASPLSFIILLKSFGCRIFDAWNGTTTLLLATFMKILWLPFCLSKTKPFRSSVEIACDAVIRGSRAILLVRERYFYGRKRYVFWFVDLFMFGGHGLKIQLYRFMDIGKRLIIGLPLRIAALQSGALRKVAVLVFFYNDRKAICFHVRSIAYCARKHP